MTLGRAREEETWKAQELDNSRRQKNKLPWSWCHWSHSSSEMGVDRPVHTELFGCCPLPSKDSALSHSMVRGAPLHAVFSNNLGALFRSTRAPHLQHNLTSPDLRSRCFLSSGFVGCASAMRSRITDCLSSARTALSQLSPW